MKSFLDNRQEIGNITTGKISGGSGFSSMKTPTSDKSPDGAEEIANPNGENSPKVEVIRSGDKITHIMVTFGEQRVEIKCNL
jgi:hypothetical protein